MTDVAISTQMQDRTPGKSLDEVSAEQIRGDGLYAYTAIQRPARHLDERIYHVWQFNGKEVDRIALDIHGGRKEGYRAWTHKQNFPGNPAGKWQVRVLTEDGPVDRCVALQAQTAHRPKKSNGVRALRRSV